MCSIAEWSVVFIKSIPWSSVLLVKLTGPQLIKKLPALYGNRKFITGVTTALHLSLSRARAIKSMPHPTSWRSVLIWSSHLCLGLPDGLLPSDLPHQNPVWISCVIHTCHMPHPYCSFLFDHPNDMWWGIQMIKLFIMEFSALLCHFVLLGPQIPSSAPYSLTPEDCVPPSLWETRFYTHTKQQAKL
jgi:hypothetical protein